MRNGNPMATPRGEVTVTAERRLAGQGGTRRVHSVWRMCADATVITPLHSGSGQLDHLPSEERPDMALTQDADGSPCILGSTLRGLLRHHLAARLCGYRSDDSTAERVTSRLFGSARDDGHHGRIDVRDATVKADSIQVAIRNRLHPGRGVVDATALFDMELIPVGSTFPIEATVTVEDGADELELLSQACAALAGFDDVNGIRVGMATNRGYGKVRTSGWRAYRWAFADGEWFAYDSRDPEADFLDKELTPYATAHDAVDAALKQAGMRGAMDVSDHRVFAALRVPIRVPGGWNELDWIERQSGPVPERDPVTRTGTSIAGAVRAEIRRALRAILPSDDADALFADIFGGDAGSDRPPEPSRCRVEMAKVVSDGLERRPRVALNPHSREVRHLFHDVVLADGKAELTFIVEGGKGGDVSPEDLAVLVLIVKALYAGRVAFGGHSSVGYGRAELDGTASLRLPDGETLSLTPDDEEPRVDSWLKALVSRQQEVA